MEIEVGDKKLRRALADGADAKRLYGADMAKKLQLRVSALKAAISLADFWPPKSGPERCHELIGSERGIFTVDLVQPYRLLFRPADDTTVSDRSNEQERWKRIKAILLIAIEDTHE